MERAYCIRDIGNVRVRLVYDFRRVENQAQQTSVGGLTLSVIEPHGRDTMPRKINSWLVYMDFKKHTSKAGRVPLSFKRLSRLRSPHTCTPRSTKSNSLLGRSHFHVL